MKEFVWSGGAGGGLLSGHYLSKSRSLTPVRKQRDRVPFGCAQGMRDDTQGRIKEKADSPRKNRAERKRSSVRSEWQLGSGRAGAAWKPSRWRYI